MTTGVVPWWDRPHRLLQQLGDPWWPERPDIDAGDWVHGAMSNGFTNSVHVGSIDGVINVDSDLVTMTLNASDFTQILEGGCSVDNGPGTNFSIDPNNGTYVCDFADMGWDIVPGENIWLTYREPDQDQVLNVFYEPAPYLTIQKHAEGTPAEGGNFTMRIQYRNQGEAAAENVVISDTFLYGLTYITDTSGLPHTGTGTPGDPLMWDVGTVDPGDWIDFYVFASVTASAGQQVGNSAGISTSSFNASNPEDTYVEMWSDVQPNDTHLNVGKHAWTGDPLPDSNFVWAVNVCNHGGTTSTVVVVTDTLPTVDDARQLVGTVPWLDGDLQRRHKSRRHISGDAERLV